MRSLRTVSESDRAGDLIEQLGHSCDTYDLISPSRKLINLKALFSGVTYEVNVAMAGGCR